MSKNNDDFERRLEEAKDEIGIHEGMSKEELDQKTKELFKKLEPKQSKSTYLNLLLFVAGIGYLIYLLVKELGVAPEFLSDFIYLFIFIIIFVGVIYLWTKKGIKKERSRTKALHRMAVSMNYTFWEDPMSEFNLAPLPHFTKQDSRKLFNHMIGTEKDHNMHVFDYEYITPNHFLITGDSEPSSIKESVFLFEFNGNVRFPEFQIRPETIAQKLITFLGAQDIDFSKKTEFSKKFRLFGNDESQIRTFFNPDMLYRLARMDKDVWIEGAENQVVIFWYGKRYKPNELRRKIDEAKQIAQIFSS